MFSSSEWEEVDFNADAHQFCPPLFIAFTAEVCHMKYLLWPTLLLILINAPLFPYGKLPHIDANASY